MPHPPIPLVQFLCETVTSDLQKFPLPKLPALVVYHVVSHSMLCAMHDLIHSVWVSGTCSVGRAPVAPVCQCGFCSVVMQLSLSYSPWDVVNYSSETGH